MNPQENKRPVVTLEDLLRFKRAERPSAEFWIKFESELRAKQLAAIVEKRPWWRTASIAGIMRHRVSLGASAILAVTFFSVRAFYPASVGTNPLPSPVGIASTLVKVEAPELIVQEPVLAAAAVASSSETSVPESYAVTDVVDESAGLRGSDSAVAVVADTKEVPQTASWLLAAERADTGALTPTARSIADNWAAAKESYPEAANRFFGLIGFEKRSLPSTRQVVDPLAQMRTPADFHAERLLASVVPTSTVRPGRTGERIARRISDERLTEDAISRFGARGNELSLKF